MSHSVCTIQSYNTTSNNRIAYCGTSEGSPKHGITTIQSRSCGMVFKTTCPNSFKKIGQDKITYFVLHLFVKDLSLLTTSVNN